MGTRHRPHRRLLTYVHPGARHHPLFSKPKRVNELLAFQWENICKRSLHSGFWLPCFWSSSHPVPSAHSLSFQRQKSYHAISAVPNGSSEESPQALAALGPITSPSAPCPSFHSHVNNKPHQLPNHTVHALTSGLSELLFSCQPPCSLHLCLVQPFPPFRAPHKYQPESELCALPRCTGRSSAVTTSPLSQLPYGVNSVFD